MLIVGEESGMDGSARQVSLYERFLPAVINIADNGQTLQLTVNSVNRGAGMCDEHLKMYCAIE